jgi:hypothetical protein
MYMNIFLRECSVIEMSRSCVAGWGQRGLKVRHCLTVAAWSISLYKDLQKEQKQLLDKKRRSKTGPVNRTGLSGRTARQGCQDRTAKIGLPEQVCHDRTARIRQPGPDWKTRPARTGQAKQGCQNRTFRIGLPGQDCQDETATSGLLG